MSDPIFGSVDQVQDALRTRDYLADRGLATSIHLAVGLDKPLLLEGEAGVGKTEVGKVLADVLGRQLIRLQCYEGIDAGQALYEWDYSRQLLAARTPEIHLDQVKNLFASEFLVERPLLSAIKAGSRAVLLIDELDRADDEFEAFLLEILSDFAVSIPEIGRISADGYPVVVITSNRTRELHDALKRRCLYHWIDHPTVEREIEIVKLRAPGVPANVTAQAVRVVARLRDMDLFKRPGVAETIDFANALNFLGSGHLDPDIMAATLGAVIKDHDDEAVVRTVLEEVLAETGSANDDS